MNIEQFRKAGHQAIEDICSYYENLDSLNVRSDWEPGHLQGKISADPPRDGEDSLVLREDYLQKIMPGLTHWQHPSFFAYFPQNASFEALLGDIYAGAVSNPGFNWHCSPACTELEAIVMDLAAKMLGLESAFWTVKGPGGGMLMSSASESCLTVAVGAREKALRYIETKTNPTAATPSPATRAGFTQKLIAYGSTQTHSIGSKACLILGLIWRPLPVNGDLSLRGETLQKAIQQDMEAGFVPFMVIGTVGTTSSGAIDRIEELGRVVKHYPSITFYVDGAWAGVCQVCPEYRDACQLQAINKYADAFDTNFHKWGLTNFACSMLYVRNRHLLTDALDVTPEYLRTKHSDTGTVIDYRNWQLPLGRKFRSLKVWFVIRGIGISGFQEHIRRAIKFAQLVEALVQTSSNLKLVVPRSFALVVFRLEPAGFDKSQLNELNKAYYARISERHDVIFTQTVLPENLFCIRWAIGAPATQNRHIITAWQVLEEEAKATLAVFKPNESTHA